MARTLVLASLFAVCSLKSLGKDASVPLLFHSAEELQSHLERHVAQGRFQSAQWGIKIVSAKTGDTLFEHNPDLLLKPASNAKLYSGALGLEKLGADFRIKTSVFAKSKPNGEGVIEGDLIIYGRGDPSFSVRFNGGNYEMILQPLVAAITNAGIKEVRGKLLGDETYFRGPPYRANWSWDDLQYYYGAEVSSLTVQDNVVDLFISNVEGQEECVISAKPAIHPLQFINRSRAVNEPGFRELTFHRPPGQLKVYASGQITRTDKTVTDAVSVPNPGKWFLMLLKDALSRSGVKVVGELGTASWPENTQALTNGLEEVAFSLSPTYAEMLPRMMKPSQNLYAQLFLLQVGAQAAAQKRDAATFTEDLGIAEMNRFITKIGVPRGGMLLDEGSGLSRSALVTPAATVALLQYMGRTSHAKVFFDSLPVGGVDGTLRTRFKGEGLLKNVRAKTGTIRYVNSLSGYMTTVAGEDLVFAIMLNAYRPTGFTTARQDIDRILELLYRYDPEAEEASGGVQEAE
ncbi:MAG: D-alanyl-D-alanine carboxypeptidase/D-alanyl-D-alanine endopeptidase [Verrucomicrobiales bacterium]